VNRLLDFGFGISDFGLKVEPSAIPCTHGRSPQSAIRNPQSAIRNRYSGRGRFCGWLLGIAGHKVADHYRRQRSDVPLESAEDLYHSDPPPEEVAATHLELERVSRALQALAPEQNQALTLRIFGELSAAEVGRIMGKSEAAVKMLVHRGLRKLQERLTFAPEVSQ